MSNDKWYVVILDIEEELTDDDNNILKTSGMVVGRYKTVELAKSAILNEVAKTGNTTPDQYYISVYDYNADDIILKVLEAYEKIENARQ